MNRFFLMIGLCLSVWTLAAQTYPVSDRSLAFAAAYTVPTSALQVEAGYYNVWNLGMQETIDLSGYSTRLRFGLSDVAEFRAGVSYNKFSFGNDGFSAFEDLEFGIKTKVIGEGQVMPGIYLMGNVSFPELNQPSLVPRDFKNSSEVRLIVEKYLNDIFIVGGNIGYRSGSSRAGLNYVAAVRASVTSDISIYAEYFGRKHQGVNYDFIDAAIEFWIWDGVAIDIAVGAGVTELSDGGFISLGIVKLFE